MTAPLVAVLVLASVGLLGCQAAEPSASPTGPVRFEPAGPGEVAPLIRAAAQRALAEHRRALVYVGAPWCQPCEAFHAAAARGELDAALPGLTLIEFDAERDGGRLAAAGYRSRLVPLFARPQPDGTASGLAIEGARSGGDYVAELTARLGPLLDAR